MSVGAKKIMLSTAGTGGGAIGATRYTFCHCDYGGVNLQTLGFGTTPGAFPYNDYFYVAGNSYVPGPQRADPTCQYYDLNQPGSNPTQQFYARVNAADGTVDQSAENVMYRAETFISNSTFYMQFSQKGAQVHDKLFMQGHYYKPNPTPTSRNVHWATFFPTDNPQLEACVCSAQGLRGIRSPTGCTAPNAAASASPTPQGDRVYFAFNTQAPAPYQRTNVCNKNFGGWSVPNPPFCVYPGPNWSFVTFTQNGPQSNIKPILGLGTRPDGASFFGSYGGSHNGAPMAYNNLYYYGMICHSQMTPANPSNVPNACITFLDQHTPTGAAIYSTPSVCYALSKADAGPTYYFQGGFGYRDPTKTNANDSVARMFRFSGTSLQQSFSISTPTGDNSGNINNVYYDSDNGYVYVQFGSNIIAIFNESLVIQDCYQFSPGYGYNMKVAGDYLWLWGGDDVLKLPAYHSASYSSWELSHVSADPNIGSLTITPYSLCTNPIGINTIGLGASFGWGGTGANVPQSDSWYTYNAGWRTGRIKNKGFDDTL